MFRNHWRRQGLLFCIILLCSISSFFVLTQVAAQETGGTVRMVLRSDIHSMDPVRIEGIQNSTVAAQVYETLVKYNSQGELVPVLATSWEFSEDGKTVTFHLRKDVQFSDGTDFDASAVKFHYDRLMDPDVASPRRESTSEGIDSVEVVDEHTVQFHLPQPNAAFIDTYVLDAVDRIGSPASIKKHGYEDTGLNAVAGTGPFVLKEYRSDRHIKLVRNDNYWGGAPKLKGVTFIPIPERQSAVAELRTGGVDLMIGVTPQSLETLEEDPNIDVVKSPKPSIRGLWFQVKSFPFTNVNVRKALIYGLPREEIVNSFLEGIAQPIDTMLPLSSWANDPNAASYNYDVQKARDLLEGQGWIDKDNDGIREKDGEELRFTLTSPDGRYLADKEICQAAANSWSKIGAKVKVEVLAWGAWISEIYSAEEKTHDMTFMGWAESSVDPTVFHNDLIKTGGSGNVHNYSNETVDAILAKAQRIPDQDIRKGLYYAVEQILHDEVAWIPLHNDYGVAAYRKNLKGYEYTPFQYPDFSNAYLED